MMRQRDTRQCADAARDATVRRANQNALRGRGGAARNGRHGWPVVVGRERERCPRAAGTAGDPVRSAPPGI